MSKIECLHCGRSSQVQPGNTTLYLFSKQPWFSYLEFICSKCGQISKPFLGPYWRGWVEDMVSLEVGQITEDWATPELIEDCNKVFGIHMLIPHQLGPRHERQIAFFHWLIERGLAEDELEA